MTVIFKALRAAHALVLSCAFLMACGGDARERPFTCDAGSDGCAEGPDDEPPIHTPPLTGSDASIGQTTALRVELTVAGAERTCGGCAVLTAAATGGVAPYTYEWSDATLIGPGPHQVCPEQSADYAVQVTDTGSAGVELARPAEQVTASASLPCSTADGGQPLQGCEIQYSSNVVDILLDPAAAEELSKYSGRCDKLEQPREDVSAHVSYMIPRTPLRAGQTYTYAWDLPLTVYFGAAMTVSYWAGNGCNPEEKVGELVFDGRAKMRFCFTPKKAYERLFTITQPLPAGAVPITFTGASTVSLCAGCETE